MATRSEWQGQKLGLLDQQSRLSQVCIHMSQQLAIPRSQELIYFLFRRAQKKQEQRVVLQQSTLILSQGNKKGKKRQF